MPQAKQLTAPGSSPGRASGPVSVGMSDLELGYPVCAGAGAECTLSPVALATSAPTTCRGFFCSAVPTIDLKLLTVEWPKDGASVEAANAP